MRNATRCALAAGCLLLSIGCSGPPPERKPAAKAAQPSASPAPLTATPGPQPVSAKPAPKTAVAKPTPALSPPAQPLANPPAIVKAVYFTGWSAGLRRRVDYLVDLHKTTAINAVVIDIKDYSGNVSYAVSAPEARQYHAVRVMIRDFDGLVNRLHHEGIYVIARLTVFQDPVLAEARPDLAVHRVSKLPKEKRGPLTADSLWRDRKGLAWIDPASRPAWEYVVSIARDAARPRRRRAEFRLRPLPFGRRPERHVFPALGRQDAQAPGDPRVLRIPEEAAPGRPAFRRPVRPRHGQ